MAPLLDPSVCEWDTARFFLFSANVFAEYIYYSHLFPAASALLLGMFVWIRAPRNTLNISLLTISIAFSLWSISDLILWATEKTQVTMFFWSIMIYFDLIIYVATFFLCHIFIRGRVPSIPVQVALTAPFVPLWLLSHTSYNLIGFDYSNCDREALEGPLWQYVYMVELLIACGIVWLGTQHFLDPTKAAQRKDAALMILGSLIFLLAFSWGNIVGSLAIDWDLGQYGLFGMPVFLSLLSYLVVTNQGFGVKVLAAQMLVGMVSVLVFAILLVRTIDNARIIAVITGVLTTSLGVVLVRSVKREIAQRELIEKQERELQIVNQQQETLLHFISHEVKGFLSDGQNAFAAIVEGDFGEAPPKVKDLSQTALQKMRTGVNTVMDILDASNLKKGAMTFNMTTFDLRKVVETTIAAAQDRASTKRISLTFDAPQGEMVHIGDAAKIERHVVRNLIDNAIRYTPSGAITVTLSRENAFYRLEVADTGVGITDEDKVNLFTEGGHGKDSIKINVDSTGFGLFVAKQVVVAHGGRIWAESEGKGKGSRFIVELPLVSRG